MDAGRTFPEIVRQRVSGEPASLGVSLVLHCSILAALTLSISRSPVPPPPLETRSMDISVIPGDGKETEIPKVAAPKADESKVEPDEPVAAEPVSPQPAEPVEPAEPRPVEASRGSTTNTPPATDAGAPDSGGSIWTPPAPTPNAADAGMTSTAIARERVVLPNVQLGKGASDAVLMSYDQGRFSDAASNAEALRLTGEGRITMSASVDDKGMVTQCVVSITSGSRLLDERACALISSYQYRPAQDARGVPHASIVSEVLEWAKDGVFGGGDASSQATGARPPAGVPGRVSPSPVVTRMPTVAMPIRR